MMEHRAISRTAAQEHGYPSNVVVHGNGFIQIELGGTPETRIHIWNRDLDKLTQNVNTRKHNHRFGFYSTIISGALEQHELTFYETEYDGWSNWQADGPHTETGSRLLVRKPGFWRLARDVTKIYGPNTGYSMQPMDFHETVPLTAALVTLFTKTVVIPEDQFQASVFCRRELEPDQTYSRFQIPWEQLRDQHIRPALAPTQFAKAEIFR